MTSPSASHDTTPLLLAPASGHVSPAYTPRSSYAASVVSPPSSNSSSSSSMTVRVAPSSSRTLQTNPALLRAPHAQDTQGLTPPPSYSSIGTNPPPNPWTSTPTGASDPPPHFESYNSRAPTTNGIQGDDAVGSPPAFDLFASTSPHVHQFGPTPLGRAATVPYAAYIDAPGAPDARAWRRFVGAFGLALLFFLLMSVGVALEVIGERGWMDLKR